MDVIYALIPGMILLGLGMVVAFIFAAKSGQFDDLEGAAHRILMDDDDHPPSGGKPSEEKRKGEGEGEGAGADAKEKADA